MDRLTGAVVDSRHPRYITQSRRDLRTQRVFQIASGYEGNDANVLRSNPLFKLAGALDDDNLRACGATFSRLEGALRRRDIYRMVRALPKA